jgi:hypothetical protein
MLRVAQELLARGTRPRLSMRPLTFPADRIANKDFPSAESLESVLMSVGACWLAACIFSVKTSTHDPFSTVLENFSDEVVTGPPTAGPTSDTRGQSQTARAISAYSDVLRLVGTTPCCVDRRHSRKLLIRSVYNWTGGRHPLFWLARESRLLGTRSSLGSLDA